MTGLAGYLTDQIKILHVADAAADGTTAVNSSGVDMQQDGGYDGVVFIAGVATAAANNTLKVQQSSDNGSSDTYADIAGAETAPGASVEWHYVDVQRPQERYVRGVLTRGTSTVAEAMWAILYRGRSLPVSQAATIVGAKVNRPDEE